MRFASADLLLVSIRVVHDPVVNESRPIFTFLSSNVGTPSLGVKLRCLSLSIDGFASGPSHDQPVPLVLLDDGLTGFRPCVLRQLWHIEEKECFRLA